MLGQRKLMFILCTVFLSIFSKDVLVGADGQCPAAEDVAPCVCESNEYGVAVTCSDIKSDSEIFSAIASVKNIYLSQFIIKDSNIEFIRSDLFSGTKIHGIKLYDVGLKSLGPDSPPPFSGIENLDNLVIDGCFKDTPLTKLSLSHLKSLTYLSISNNKVPALFNEWFQNGPYTLKHVFFNDNNVEIMDSHVFAPLENIEKLWLSGNTLEKVTRNMFPNPANKLTELDLSLNELDYLPDDIFTGMPALTEINLSENEFTTISEKLFKPVWAQLVTFDISENPIHCDASIKWIYETRLPVNFEGSCESPARLAGKELKELEKDDL